MAPKGEGEGVAEVVARGATRGVMLGQGLREVVAKERTRALIFGEELGEVVAGGGAEELIP